MLTRTHPEDSFHASFELALAALGDVGQLRDPDRRTEAFLHVRHDSLEGLEGHVVVGWRHEISAHGDQPDDRAGAVADGDLRGQVPAELAIGPADQFELVIQRLARCVDLSVLLLVSFGELSDEVVASCGADHVADRAFAGSPDEG